MEENNKKRSFEDILSDLNSILENMPDVVEKMKKGDMHIEDKKEMEKNLIEARENKTEDDQAKKGNDISLEMDKAGKVDLEANDNRLINNVLNTEAIESGSDNKIENNTTTEKTDIKETNLEKDIHNSSKDLKFEDMVDVNRDESKEKETDTDVSFEIKEEDIQLSAYKIEEEENKESKSNESDQVLYEIKLEDDKQKDIMETEIMLDNDSKKDYIVSDTDNVKKIGKFSPELEELISRKIPDGVLAERIKNVGFVYSYDEKLLIEILKTIDDICLFSKEKPMFVKRSFVKDYEEIETADSLLIEAKNENVVAVVLAGEIALNKVYEIENLLSQNNIYFINFKKEDFSKSRVIDFIMELIVR